MTVRETVYRALQTGDLSAIAPPTDFSGEGAPELRLAGALGAGLPQPADLVPLVRHLVLSETGRILRVAAGPGWPQPTEWEAHGFQVLAASEEGFQLEASPWRPEWLPRARQNPPERATVQGVRRREREPAPGDRFLSGFGFSEYQTDGQRQAVRATLAAPPGSSLIVNLPTGAGKSLCGHVLGRLPFLWDGSGGRGVVVAVVPTTALALDQARAFGGPERVLDYAYTGGGAGNEGIRQRIREGEQSIVFTSPEGLMASLRPALYAAAGQGLLKALVIDEAHMVDVWGDEFRPAFQEVAGLRRALLRVCPDPGFRTLLLSATLTDASVETLQWLFGNPEPCRMVAAVQLRPEPAYWVRNSETEAERAERVLEALRHLPRPLILYVTERADAYAWERRLRALGHRRLDCMTGDTPTAAREAILRRWTENRTDIVVATAAFGLGMDKGDVRAVVHACLPETLDRFYQEVGRGGRDGHACLSLLLYTHRDARTAIKLAARRLITTEVGLRRWRALFEAKETLPDGRIRVDLATAPGITSEHIDMVGERSVVWNARTLTLLQRAGMIELDDSIAEENSGDKRTLRILDQGHLAEETWHSRVEPCRAQSLQVAATQRKSMMELIRGRRCGSEILTELYRLPQAEVARSCGGCPACRRDEREPFVEAATPTPWPWPGLLRAPGAIERNAKGYGGFLVYYARSERQDRLLRALRRFVEWAARQGVRQIVGPRAWLLARRLIPTEPPVFLLDTFRPREMPALPTLVLYPPEEPPTKREFPAVRHRLESRAGLYPPCVALMAEDALDPALPGRALRDMLGCPQYALDTLVERERIA